VIPRLDIRLTLSPRGCHRGFEPAGHAGAEPPGSNIACAAGETAAGDWLRGVTDFLLRGLSDLAEEIPREVLVRWETMEV
jgi:hypothetical protein